MEVMKDVVTLESSVRKPMSAMAMSENYLWSQKIHHVTCEIWISGLGRHLLENNLC